MAVPVSSNSRTWQARARSAKRRSGAIAAYSVSTREITGRQAWADRQPEPAMPRRPAPALEFEPLTLTAATWLACGMVLYGLTPLPLRDANLGWSTAFWLLAAPAILLLARRFFAPSHSKRLLRKVRPKSPSMAKHSVAVLEFTGSGHLRSHCRQATRRSGTIAKITQRRRCALPPSA